MRLTPALAILAAASLVATPSLADKHNKGKAAITAADVEAAQKAWGESIVAVSTAKREGRDPKPYAEKHINTFYGYKYGTVLFKPTVAAVDQFRGTYDEALSYFIGGSNPEDKGFALNPWTNVRWENEGVITDKDSAIAMGNVYFTKTDGSVTKAEFTLGFFRNKEGNVMLNVHHSSIPFSPPAAPAAAAAKK